MNRLALNLVAALVFLSAGAAAEPAGKAGSAGRDQVLIALHAGQAEIAGGRLVLSQVARHMLWSADRAGPQGGRQAGRVPTMVLTEAWAQGADRFAQHPPNAVPEGRDPAGTEARIAVRLRQPQWQDGNLSFAVTPLPGRMPVPVTGRLTDVHLVIGNRDPQGGM